VQASTALTDPSSGVVPVPVADDVLPADLPAPLPVDEALPGPVTDVVESVPSPREVVGSVIGSRK
jgi:hypothetical protein